MQGSRGSGNASFDKDNKTKLAIEKIAMTNFNNDLFYILISIMLSIYAHFIELLNIWFQL